MGEQKKKKITFREFLLNYNAILILVVLIVLAAIVSPLFLTTNNIGTLLKQQAPYLVIAVGMMMVIITAGIDLAAAGTVALASVVMVTVITSTGNTFLGLLASLGIGVLVGCFNGFFVAVTRMPSFIVTLALTYIAQGICFMITKGNTLMLENGSPAYNSLVYPGFASIALPLNIPIMALVAIGIVIIFYIIMKYTKFGRLVYAVGSNENAVQLAGINSKKIIFLVWVLEGLLCGVASIFLVARTGNASALTCSGDYALSCVASVVIGGASLAGGEGSVPMTVVGVFVIALIGNIMNLVGMASYPQMVVKGAIIIFAVILKGISSKKVS